jgi:serine/threonine protein kinase
MADELKAGRYLIARELGRGGMGHVYLARDQKLGRNVALKMLPAEITHDAELRRRLAQEARAASALSHPGVATVFDYVEEGGESFIVFELVEGRTLREEMTHRRFTTEDVLDVGIQLADALAYAHEHGVVHRDLKPENIMLAPGSGHRGRAKILDFGLAKLARPLSGGSMLAKSMTAHAPWRKAGETHAASAGVASAETAAVSTSPGLLVGTVNYMSPEQAAMQPADARSDLYSLGLVLYELSAGVNPFLGESPTSTIANIIKVEAPPVTERNPVAPPELDRILRKCLRKRAEERYQSSRELLVDLRNLSAEIRPPGTAPAPPESNLKEMERPLEIPRYVARGLVAAIQLAYLAMYATALWKTDDIYAMLEMIEKTGKTGATNLGLLVVMIALIGTCVRLYVLAGIGLDFADLGRKYRRLFPASLVLDLAWSPVAFLLSMKVGLLALLFFVALAYLPFTQRPLLFSAYSPHGGRTSGIRAAGAS